MILVTGGAGFIGSNFVQYWIEATGESVINLDKLTYSGNLENLAPLKNNKKHLFVKGDILNRDLIRDLLHEHQPRAIVHIAAETHVDRSIIDPEPFVNTNVVGTFSLLEETRRYWDNIPNKDSFRFLHVSTDEVFGTLGLDDEPFKETSCYFPNSPYAASKAASDHMVRAYHQTYGLPTLISNCSNNFGPYQYPEKLIPLMIIHALHGKPLPIYGDGLNIRNWLYVNDHSRALQMVLDKGLPGGYYNIGGDVELTNQEVVEMICVILDELKPNSPHKPHASLIQYVKDRPGHDRRYAIDARKIHRELGWKPKQDFKTNLRETIQWYLENEKWVQNMISGDYRNWIEQNYTQRETVV